VKRDEPLSFKDSVPAGIRLRDGMVSDQVMDVMHHGHVDPIMAVRVVVPLGGCMSRLLRTGLPLPSHLTPASENYAGIAMPSSNASRTKLGRLESVSNSSGV